MPERTAVLVIRVWTSDEEGWRARVVTSEDVLSGEETSVAASEVEEICGIVRAWLEPLTVRGAGARSPRLTPR